MKKPHLGGVVFGCSVSLLSRLWRLPGGLVILISESSGFSAFAFCYVCFLACFQCLSDVLACFPHICLSATFQVCKANRQPRQPQGKSAFRFCKESGKLEELRGISGAKNA